MKITRTTKKTTLAVFLVAAMALTAFHTVSAGPYGKGGYGQGYHPCQTQVDAATNEAQDKFYKDTTDLRKQITQKHAEMRALMHNENVDAKAVAALSGDLFDLKEQMKQKADEAGVNGFGRGHGMMGRGYGMGMKGGGNPDCPNWR